MLHCWWNLSELNSQQPTALLLTDHVQMPLVCLRALLINYAHGVAFYALERALYSKCMYSICVSGARENSGGSDWLRVAR